MTQLPLTMEMAPASIGCEVRLAHARIEDAAAVARVHVSTWQAAYKGVFSSEYLAALSVTQRELLWREVISHGSPEVVVAVTGEIVVGFIAFGAPLDGSKSRAGEIWAMYVSPSYWSQGIGQRLWRHARERFAEQNRETVSLWVLAANTRALRFYVAAGFKPDPTGSREVAVPRRTIKELRYITNLRSS